MTSYDFDARPAARPLFKERLLWTLVIGLFFFLIYGSSNHISALRAPHPAIFFGWEHAIPFIPELILPYMSSDILFIIAFAMAPTRDAIQKLGIRCGLAIAISAVVFLVMPLQFDFTRPAVEGWPAVMLGWLSLDQPYNQFPSLHISLGFLAWHAITARMPWWLRLPVTCWFLAIAFSTVAVYQHHSIDILGGALVAALVFWLVPERGRSRFPLRFVTPRHLHMAFRYLVVSVLLTVLAFNLGLWGLVPGWIALSLLLVAAGYTLGHNGFLLKRSRRHGPVAWLLYGPFLIGSWVNWRYWRSRVPLSAEVAPGLSMGARPAGADWSDLQKMGVRQVLDLAPELWSSAPKQMDHRSLPLLDIAIPAPEQLDRLAEHIETAREDGGLYVHCALGMSRSVMAVAAWMIKQGASVDTALAALDKIRPERVQRPYVRIALDLYADFLKGKA